MAKAVYLNNENVVIHCCHVSDEDIHDINGQKIENMLECICKKRFGLETTWIEVDNDLGVFSGYIFDEINQKFLFPKPHSNWILNEFGNWVPPKPRPDLDLELNQAIQWNQDLNDWEIISV